MPIIAIANRKGRVGKTTVSCALATKLAEKSQVLLVDLDSQANATEALGIELRPGIAEWLILEHIPKLTELDQGLSVMPGDMKTEKANTSMASDADIAAIDRGLRSLRHRFDYVIQGERTKGIRNQKSKLVGWLLEARLGQPLVYSSVLPCTAFGGSC